MFESKVDVAVLLIFFSRVDNFAKVFEQVRKARPSKLFLYQDGPRNDQDIMGINACRKVVDQGIDWECEVEKLYQDENIGCDPSEYIAQKWAFSFVDKLIVLEDDDVPSGSFFLFCKELLDKYENDTRIFKISGMNIIDEYNPNGADYFFTKLSPIWGWASWRRSFELCDTQYAFLEDNYVKGQLKQQLIGFEEKIKTCQDHKRTGKEHYESLLWSAQFSNNMLNVVPAKNMITNIGVDGGTHYSKGYRALSKNYRDMLLKKRYEIKFPLKHPEYVIDDIYYYKKTCWILGLGHPIIRAARKISSMIRTLVLK